ncbi:MAG: leucine-rich repeat protein [Oscillospiraceae bacterium]|nr:leucine-rich repeat protein [Oscillospiraceae bacterium]
MKKCILTAVLCLLLCIAGCKSAEKADTVTIVLEKGAGFTAEQYALTVPRGSRAQFRITELDGSVITGADRDCEIERTLGGVTVTRTANYTERVRLRVRRSDKIVTYTLGDESVSVPVAVTHLRHNTETDLFGREGYTLASWIDERGNIVPLGARTESVELTANLVKWSPESDFEISDGALARYLGSDKTVCVPGGVRTILAGAFENCASEVVILPETVRTIEAGAFKNASISELFMFDSVQNVSDLSFSGCDRLGTLTLNAAAPPRYSGTYYATLADKHDRLLSLADIPKIVLFSGSSARFGYDSAAIDAAFPDYEVVNMGVFAYSNALPQLELIRNYLRPGDILLLSPELDAAKRQFCTTNALDSAFWRMTEADYGMVRELDLREYSLVFSSLSEFLSERSSLEARDYAVSPSDFDEDGAGTLTPSYNEYGDYIIYRPNSDSDAPLYGLEVPYRADYYLRELYLAPFNAEIERFKADGIKVYITYSPRNRLAVSSDTTDETIRELDGYFRENITAPIITDIFDSLVDGKYLYGTDNHLTTEGVRIRTEAVIAALREELAR